MQRHMLVIVLIAATLTTASAGQTDKDGNSCESRHSDVRIAACTRLIVGGRESPKDTATALFNRAAAYAETNAMDKAIADLSEAIRLHPMFYEAFNNRGSIYYRKGDLDRALADFDRTVRLNPSYAIGFNNRGFVNYKKKECARALKDFNQALSLDPRLAAAYFNRANIFSKTGRDHRALDDVNQAIALDPKHLGAHELRGQLHERRGLKDRAIVDYRTANRLSPRRSDEHAARKRAAERLTVLTQSSPSPIRRKHLALVIGNDRYDKLDHLKRAVNDARTITRILVGLGFQVTRLENAARRTISEKLVEFAGRIEPGDTAFFFYAGHGVEIGGKNYLLPTDTPAATEGQEALITSEAIPTGRIIELFQSNGAKISMLVLDACRDNPFKRFGRSVGAPRGLGQIHAPRGVFILYSAGYGQVALDRLDESDTDSNSVFTRIFARLLRKPALSILEIAKRTQTDVHELAMTVGHKQMPAYYDQILGSFPLSALPTGDRVD